MTQGLSRRPAAEAMPQATTGIVPATRPADGPGPLRLSTLEGRQPAVVAAIDAAAAGPERRQQLADIGFLPGEPVMVMARGWPGGDPLVVRIGHSTFALRRSEADCIEVRPSTGERA